MPVLIIWLPGMGLSQIRLGPCKMTFLFGLFVSIAWFLFGFPFEPTPKRWCPQRTGEAIGSCPFGTQAR